MTNVSPEWLSWGRKKWRERVTNHSYLEDQEKLRILQVETAMRDGKFTLGTSKVDEMGDDTVRAVRSAIAFSLMDVGSFRGNDYVGLSMPVSLHLWAGICEQKKASEQEPVNANEEQE